MINFLFNSIMTLLPFIIIIGVIFFVYNYFFKQRWEKFGEDLSLNVVKMKNIAFPEHIRKSDLFDNQNVRLNAYLEGARNGLNWDVYTYTITRINMRKHGYLLVSVRNNGWKSPKSRILKKKISDINNMFNQVFAHIDSSLKNKKVNSPRGFTFFCDDKKDSKFINKVNSLLEDKNNYFGYNEIHFNKESVFFVFDITKTRKVPRLINEIESFVKEL